MQWNPGNVIEALKIMGKGMLAIFIVIAIITAVVYLLNYIDKKSVMKKTAEKEKISGSDSNSSDNDNA